MRGRLDFRRRIALTAFVASLALAVMVPGGARGATTRAGAQPAGLLASAAATAVPHAVACQLQRR